MNRLPSVRIVLTMLLYALLCYGGVKYVLPVLLPFLFGLGIAALVQKPAALLASRIPRLSHQTCCRLLTAALLLCVIGLLSALICSLVGGAMSFCPGIPAHLTKARAFITEAAASGGEGSWGRFMGVISAGLEWCLDFLSENYQQYVPSVLARSSGWIRKLPSFLTAIFFGGLASLFACSEFDRICRTVRACVPDEIAETLSRLLHAVIHTITTLLRTYGVLMAITMGELAAGFALIRLMGYDTGNILATAIVIALIDILPILGTGTVLIPWGLFEILTGSVPLGLMLLGMFAVIGLVRNFLEPKFMARHLELPPFFTLAGVYIGGKLFGAVGIVLLPLLMLTAREYRSSAKKAADTKACGTHHSSAV